MNNSIAKQRYISFNLFPTWKQPVSSKGTGCFKHGNNPFLTSGHMLAISLVFLMLLSGISKAWGQTGITSLSEITDPTGSYRLTSDVSGSGHTSIATFSGTLEAAIDPTTKMPYRITGLNAPLFTTLTGTVKNLVLEDVSISGNTGNTGAIAATANDAARIYNVGILSGQVGGTGNTGGLVGYLDGTARVVNCYSFATITGGTNVGGIVGYNKQTTSAANNNQKTMVFACMFYGDITGGTTISPVYGGQIISNAGTSTTSGVSNFNYFRLEAPYVQPTGITYNCALGAEDRFLQRFEFYRLLLNGHRELAGWWATGTFSSSGMLKWVLETADRTINNPKPYPVLKTQGKYPSIINYDAEHAPTLTLVNGKPSEEDRNRGGKFGTLTVKIQMGDGAVYERPSGATITTQQLSLNITDKDPDHFNFNYYKVQLPYYNDVGTKNYTGNRVVTGWKIVNIEGGTPGTYTPSDTWGGYNFADRNCTNKDLYGTGGSNRIFNQGAYWDVPEGVTSITIEPYWAKCVYLADPNADKIYKSDMSAGYDVSNVGGGVKYTNGSSYSIAGEDQVVYTSIGNAIASSGSALFSGYTDAERNNQSVYDYAVVLVGNYHHYYTTNKIEASKAKPYTVTSIDLDGDNEPDYSYILRFDGRCECHPMRADFINIPGLGMAQKSTGGTGSYNFGILIPKGWFESTNTSLLRFTQFEYEHSSRSTTDALIVQGGVMEQWVSNNQKGTSNKTPYIHVGGNVWFKEFHTGCHQDKQIATLHSPISVTGGDYDEFYLTGLYRGDITNKEDNAECYINGGRFGTVCGAAMEGIGKANGANDTGNITWLIQNADIHEFYAGGLNAAKPVTGNLSTTIIDSHVDIFCGGPKFGDMSANKTVVTNATGCNFGTFFGAGYGGNSYSRYAPSNQNSVTNINWNNWVKGQYTQSYNATYGGVSTRFVYQFLPMSDNKTNVARILIDFVKFSLATTKNVTSNLDGCTITGNFYGGGNLGKVDGNVTSTLTNCTVNGSVFGAGFSGNLPTVEVDSIGFRVEPFYYEALGTYRTGVKGATTTYTWAKKKSGDPWINNTTLYTTENLDDLGTVSGNVTLNVLGDQTQIMGDVYGGAAEAKSNTNYYKTSPTDTDLATKTTVNLIGGTILGDVYGGGLGRLAKAEVGTPGSEGYQAAVEEVEANVGNTVVNLNGMSATEYNSNTALYSTWGLEQNGENKVIPNDTKGCVVSKRIFGCNNLNGTPKGNVTVHVHKTQNASASRITNVEDEDNPENSVTKAKQKGVYDVKAVYGGGNLAAYEPTDLANAKAHVIIDGCGLTSIQTVYGGGNAASAPATLVEVNGTYEIEELFGGGNGKDAIDENTPNPGAHVGYQAYPDNATYEQRNNTDPDAGAVYIYGTGRAQVNINGGTVHAVYGGSNTKGNVREIALAMLEEISDADGLPVCDFHVDEAYGGGKSAPMDGEARLEMKCIPGMTAAYGGSRNADVNSDVTLNITNGKFEKVFGGNNEGGCVKGSITVNIEETGCRPVEIGELYGGGNQAAYSKYGYKEVSVTDPETSETTTKWVVIESPTDSQALTGDDVYDDPQVNVKSFTSIGSVFGGGLGATATMVANPHVNINQVYGKQYDSNTPKKFVDQATTLGTIGTVYGGGNAAPVIGDTYVNVGTKTTVDYVTIDTTKGETEAVTGINVVGANITGNVYGGGNAAEVTGNTNVTIGKETTTTVSPAPASNDAPTSEAIFEP